MTRATKIILALVIIVVLGMLGFFALRFFAPSQEGKSNPIGGLFFPSGGGIGGENNKKESASGDAESSTSTIESLGLVQVVKEPVIGAVLSVDGSKLMYLKRVGGNAFSASTDGTNEVRLTSLTIIGITNVQWTPDRKAAVISYVDARNMKRILLDMSTSSTTFLPSSIVGLDISPDGKNMAYAVQTQGNLRIAISDLKAAKPRIIFSSTIPDWRPHWKDSSSLLLLTVPSMSAKGLSSLLMLNGKSEEFISLPGMNLLPNLVKDMVAVSSVNDNGALQPLRIYSRKGTLISTAAVATLSEKCVWSPKGESLYCAVPEASESGLPDVWYRGNVTLNDRLVKIDAVTGRSTELIASTGRFDIAEIFVDSTEKHIYFNNKRDSTLWRLDLAKQN